jgi:hypothetical protein
MRYSLWGTLVQFVVSSIFEKSQRGIWCSLHPRVSRTLYYDQTASTMPCKKVHLLTMLMQQKQNKDLFAKKT